MRLLSAVLAKSVALFEKAVSELDWNEQLRHCSSHSGFIVENFVQTKLKW